MGCAGSKEDEVQVGRMAILDDVTGSKVSESHHDRHGGAAPLQFNTPDQALQPQVIGVKR
jgi:hypothetical protein